MIETQSAAQATETLIHQYSRLVFQVIYGLVGDWHESQDLTQDTFLVAFKAIEAARQASSANFHAKAWLLQIAANNARMSLRRRRLVRFVPFSALRTEEQDERDGELVGERPAPVQPAGYGMDGTGQDPAAHHGPASGDTEAVPGVVSRRRAAFAPHRASAWSE